MLTVLDGEGAAQPAVVAPGRVGADETRLDDVDGAWLHAQHDGQRDPGIDQPVLVDEGVVVRVDGVEVARDDAAAAPGLAQEGCQNAHLQRPPELRVERVEVHVEQTQDGARRFWDGDVHAERVPLVPAGERSAEDAVEHQLGAVLALLALALLLGEQRRAKPPAGEQRHRRERHACERRGVLSVSRQEARAHSGVVEERFPSAVRDFLEEHDVGELGSLQNVVEDEPGAFVGLRLGRLDVPCRERKRLAADGVSDCGARRRPLGGWGLLVAQRHSCPSIAGAVEGREDTRDPA